MSPLDAQDIEVLGLALDLLDCQTDYELQVARRAGGNPIKEAAIIAVRGSMVAVRAKLRVLHGGAP
jgi:hypothetical protein